ncbi:Mif2/CENP-C like-domain-containing protein [Lentinula raphanica]|nr:Mif2/CENP-C like-domain-containing protein [Lentinula raphanica]
MPEARPRQSSIGSRRRAPKAHIPYRGNSLEVTRKTGVKVAHDPDSDGFETYEHFAQQADKITPYQVKGTKNKKKDNQEPEPQDEEGDSDMEIDSPIHYIANSRQPTSPISRRASLASRPVARTTGHRFDDVPSPHSRSSAKSRRDHISAGPSRLSQQFFPSDDDPISSATRGTNGVADMSIDVGLPEDLSIQHQSFSELDRDPFDDDDAHMDEPPNSSPQRKEGAHLSFDAPSSKRKKAVDRVTSAEELPPRTQSPDVEEEIQQQLEEVDQHSDNGSAGDQEEEEEEEEEPVVSKKAKVDKGKEKQKTKGQGKKKEVHREGVRRSQRKPIKPLEWWRNEKYVYERPTHGNILVPHIKEIIRIPEEPKEPLGKHTKRKRGRSKTVQPPDKPSNPEEGWDDDTNSVVTVIDWKTKEPKEKQIICLAKDVKPHRAANSEWAYQRTFSDDNYLAAGHLTIPVHGRKPTKTTKDNTYTFYLIQGAINLKIHETSSILCTGATFMVPRGNTYFIENIGDREAKLFFSQTRQEPRAENPHSPRKSNAVGSSKTPPATKRATTTGV